MEVARPVIQPFFIRYNNRNAHMITKATQAQDQQEKQC